MKKIATLILFVATMTNAYSLGNMDSKGSTPKTGDIIEGVVKDADGPVPNARISERNHNAKELSYTFSDEKGQFSIKYIGNATYLVVECAGYHIFSGSITGTNYTINMISDQILDPHAATSYPVLILDNKIVACDSIKWKDIVPIKKYEYYTDEELALLLGIKVEEIGAVGISRQDFAELLGMKGEAENGILEVQTKKYIKQSEKALESHISKSKKSK